MFKRVKVDIKKVFKKRVGKKKFISNQRTLIATICRLMEGQTLVVCISRVINSTGNEKIIPFGFKIDSKDLPSDLRLERIHSKNLVHVGIDNVKPIEAMIVATGDDSKELSGVYNSFVDGIDKGKKQISTYQKQINHWFINEQIKVTRFDSRSLPTVPEENFDTFVRRMEILKRRRAAKVGQSKAFPQVNSECIDIGDDSESEENETDDSDFVKSSKNDSSQMNPIFPSTSKTSKVPKKDSSVNEKINFTLDKMKTIAATYHPSSSEKVFFSGVCSILDYLIKLNESFVGIEFYQSFSNDCDSLRFIPEDDPTTELNQKVTLVEGLLPLPTHRYKQALVFKPDKHKAENIIYNIIRFCFPEHWICGVTLRGSKDNQSLISIWNHLEPLRYPLCAPIDPQLGEKRFRALLDHSVRLSGKKSYNKEIEADMVSHLSKAMYYVRSKIVTVSTIKVAKNEIFLEREDDPKSSDHELQIHCVAKSKEKVPSKKLREIKITKFRPINGGAFDDIDDDSDEKNNDEEEEIIPPPKRRKFEEFVRARNCDKAAMESDGSISDVTVDANPEKTKESQPLESNPDENTKDANTSDEDVGPTNSTSIESNLDNDEIVETQLEVLEGIVKPPTVETIEKSQITSDSDPKTIETFSDLDDQTKLAASNDNETNDSTGNAPETVGSESKDDASSFVDASDQTDSSFGTNFSLVDIQGESGFIEDLSIEGLLEPSTKRPADQETYPRKKKKIEQNLIEEPESQIEKNEDCETDNFPLTQKVPELKENPEKDENNQLGPCSSKKVAVITASDTSETSSSVIDKVSALDLMMQMSDEQLMEIIRARKAKQGQSN